MKSMTIGNRAQLTPLKPDHRDKAKQDMAFETIGERRNAKGQKLNPINGVDSLKHLWSRLILSIYPKSDMKH